MNGFTVLHDKKQAASSIIDSLEHSTFREGSRDEWNAFRLISSLRLLERGVQYGKTLLVDAWPKFSCVLLVRESSEVRDDLEMFCRDDPQAIECLVAWIFRWFGSSKKSLVQLLAVPDYIWSSLEAAAADNGIQFCQFETCFNFSRQDPYDDEPQLPDNLTSRELTEDNIPIVMNKWSCSEIGNAQGWLKTTIDAGQLIIGIFDGERLIGLTLIERHGTLAAVFVEPEFRNRGLGTFLMKKMTRMMIDQKMKVVLETDDRNEMVTAFYEKLNFTCHGKTAYYNFTMPNRQL